MGGDAIFEDLKEHLGVGNGETTEDGKVTLEHIECNAACDFAPVVMVNWEFFDNQTPRVRPAAGRRPAGRPRASSPPAAHRCARSRRPPGSSPASRTSAPGAVEATGGAGPASLIGLRLAKGEAAPGRGADHVIAPRATADGLRRTDGEPRPATPPTSRPPGTPAPTTHRSRPRPRTPQHPAGPTAEEGE